MSRQTSHPPQPKSPRRLWPGLASLLLAVTLSRANAQTPPPAPDQPAAPTQSSASAQPDIAQPGNQTTPFTLKANSRVVLTDVTVTDRNGNPVHGLPRSAFHVLDNKQEQTISSFEEHTGIPPTSTIPAATPGVYTNEFLQHLPPVLNVIMLDTTNLEIVDQMSLSYELTKFFNTLPPNQPLAIYLRGGGGAYLLQNFTSDRALLLAALHKALPRVPPPGRVYIGDQDTLRQITTYLAQIPGRKNVLWFSGGSTYFLISDGRQLENYPAMRETYDALEKERIAIYPVDARGLTFSGSGAMLAQHVLMDDFARATGGQAFYTTNGLIEAVNQVLNISGSFYTLTYSPHNFRYNNKWHTVRIALDGSGYHLSYRSGYFADGSNDAPEQPAKSRTRLMPGGEKVQVSPQLNSVPIIFAARVLSASDPALAMLPPASGSVPPPPSQKGRLPYSIRYTLPIDALTLRDVDGKQQITFTVAAVAFNREGHTVVSDAQRVNMTLDAEYLRDHPTAPVNLDQQINLQKGDEYLYLAVWDTASGRLGSLQVALDVKQ